MTDPVTLIKRSGFETASCAFLAACLLLANAVNAANTTEEQRRTSTLFTAIPAEHSGVKMRHPLVADHPRAYLYISGFACGGVCIGDLNGDERPDLFFTSGPETNRLYLQTEKPFVFRDATREAGLSGSAAGDSLDRTNPWAAGASLVDLDRDGDLDIYVCNYDAPNQLFINDGRAHFMEQAREWGLDLVDASLMGAFMDIDGSGELALYLLTNRYERPGGRPQRPPVIVVNGTPQISTEFKKYYGLKRSGPGNYHVDFAGRPDRLLMPERDAEGRRRYRDVSRQAGLLTEAGHGLSATWLDYDGDARPDLYLCNDFADPDLLYRNEGKGVGGIVRFKNVIADVVPLTTWSSMGADAADINNDGLVDLMTGDMASRTHRQAMINTGALGDRLDTLLHSWPRQTMRNMLFVNTGTGRFLETAFLSGIAQTDWTWAVKLADFDNDGLVDVFITNGNSRNYTDADVPFSTEMYVGKTDWDLFRSQPPRKERNLAFRNVDGLRFEDVSQAWGLDHLGMSYAAACGDLDRDGDLDLVVCNLDETVSIYRNEGSSDRHWLEVRLKGTASHSHGWGASVRVKTASGWRVRHMNPATGFLSCNEPVLHFGLGSDAAIEALEVSWPSGRIQRLERPAADLLLTLTEPDASVVRGSPDPARVVRGSPDPARVVRGSPDPARSLPLFARAENTGLDFRHREKPYDDYAREPLLPGKLSQLGPGIAVGDANGDGRDDVYFGGAAGQPGALFVASEGGRFTRVAGPWDADCEDMGALWFDVDRDGLLDLYVVSGGVEGFEGERTFQDRLYLNRTTRGGPARFEKASQESLPDTGQSGSTACAADFDRDGDLDLFVGSRCVPGRYPQVPRSLLMRNDSVPGRPKLIDVTDQLAPGLASAGLVTSALWSDVDADGFCDLVVLAEWGPVRVFHNRQGKLVEQTEAAGLAMRTGWWNGIAGGDFNSDAQLDYLVTNVGLNTKYGAASRANPILLFAGDMEHSGGHQIVESKLDGARLLPVRARSAMRSAMPQLWQNFPTYRAYAAATLPEIFGAETLRNSQRMAATEFRTGLLVNRSTPGRLRFEWQPLPDIVQISPGFGIAVTDFSGDGYSDAAIAQNLVTREPETGLWRGGVGQLVCGTPTGSLEPSAARESGIVIPGDAKGTASLDLNGDARPDLLVAQNDDAVVTLVNQSTGRWLSLRLVGLNGTSAVGARVTIHSADGRTTAHEVYAGSGYLSQSAAEIYIGLGIAAPVRAEIHWPSGQSQSLDLKGKSGRLILKEPKPRRNQ
ncbi:MAG TPA: FG-GAP-like repeat-containing protein [Lacipirellulaceae bacterium]